MDETIFTGPLETPRNYIEHIALPNCMDYFNLLKSNREQGRHGTPDKFKEFRYFINAAESVNNIIEYIYFHTYEDNNNPPTFNQYKREFLDGNDRLKQLSDIVNAYKHCLRGFYDRRNGRFRINENAIHARDLAENEIHFRMGSNVGKPLVEVQYSFNGIDNEEILCHAFRYWTDYLNGSGNT